MFSLFAEFFLGKKKKAAHFRFRYKVLRVEFGKKIVYLNSSRKNTQFQKTNQPKRSLGSKVMSILNSTVFQSFSRKSRDFLL
jgi:transposase